MKLSQWYTKRNEKESVVTKTERADTSLPKTEDILNAIIMLNKAMDSKDWKKLYKDHQPSQHQIVDHTYHVANSKVPEAYNELIKGKKSIHVSKPDFNGISAKVIHKVGKDTFMTKPYMSSRELPRELPISGWGIMATHNLYHAGDIGDLVEKVHATTIKDPPYIGEVPVTVHHFAKGYTEAMNLEGGGPRSKTMPSTKLTGEPGSNEPIVPQYYNTQNINPLHSRQIGLMDYLVGNFDRHGGNLMVGETVDGTGHKPLLAIDHDRAFYYGESARTPKQSYEKSTMSGHLGEGASENTTQHDKAFHKWWQEKKHDIYGEMNRNLEALKDDSLRKYVRTNFDERFKRVSDWGDGFEKNGKGLFHEEIQPVPHHMLHMVDQGQVKNILDSIPQDNTSGMEMLTDLFKERREPDKKATLKQAIMDLSKKMTPKELVRFYSRIENDPEMKDTKADVLMEMKHNVHRFGHHLNEIIKTNAELPEHSRFLNPFWEKHIQDALTAHNWHQDLKEAQ